ncbi:unnamed protein product [Eruca vesicaria subsp. sativa]|uniref:Replication factor A C-terminal domain-containing protein n=1 Tax=Eruca vesicaria subsp. sativa TaxID=29727 RepID=A0ABC8LVZ9_ERUVS|nr:unnamed protein product [Eruca vesicaria subsp. sativa]
MVVVKSSTLVRSKSPLIEASKLHISQHSISISVTWCECTATIDDIVHDSAWYYISCGGCNTKATKGPTSLMCKRFLAKISVYDKSGQENFVLLGDAGLECTGKSAAELVANFFESNESVGTDYIVLVPAALVGTIGQTHNFLVKVSNYNLSGKVQSITVTKVLPPETPQEDVIAPASAAILEAGNGECGSSMSIGHASYESIKRSSDCLEPEAAKRAKSG